MPNLYIENVPDELLDKLLLRAARNHRSLQDELMALISEALESPATGAASPVAEEPPAVRRSGTRRIEEIAAEHRQRHKNPLTRGPQAIDVIRAERDTR